MLDSVRVRLTLWYSVVLAVVLISLAVLTYFLYWRNAARRTDADIAQLSEAFVTTFDAELADESGPGAVNNAAHSAMVEHRYRNTYFVLLNPSGVVTQSSLDLPSIGKGGESLSAAILSAPAFLSLVTSNSRELRTIRSGKGSYRALVRRVSVGGQDYTLVALQSLGPLKETMRDIRDTFLWAIPAALFLAAGGGYFLARKSLAPIAEMAAQARGMGAAQLHRRLAVASERDELGQLAKTFNELLERLESSFQQQRRFMADASHELRTPVAILRGEAEVTLSQPNRSPEEYRQTLSILRGESQRLSQIIEDLFTLARADAGQYPLTLRDTYLDEIATEAVKRARSLALSKNITVSQDVEPDLPICADEALLARMFLNLLDNAIKYSPSGSTVTLTCRRGGDHYGVSVGDAGSGIPAELQARIFERFFRVDNARSRSEGETGGAGLGLAIARWIAEAHHGQLTLTCSDSTGSTFTAVLPVDPRT